jgi:hypothetical protein
MLRIGARRGDFVFSLCKSPVSNFNSSGIAVISFDLSSQAICPNVRPFSLDQAITKCKAALPERFAKERRIAFSFITAAIEAHLAHQSAPSLLTGV